jgi:hypothetical protein
MPFIASSDASVAPDGPLPMMPTVWIELLMGQKLLLGLRPEGRMVIEAANASH